MAQEWFFSKGGQQQGPVDFDQLKQLAASGQVRPGDLVWCEGMAKWTEAGTIENLFVQNASQGGTTVRIPCPHCAELLEYSPQKAGSTVQCWHCHRPILMLPLDQLAPQCQEEYHREEERVRRKQEAEEQKRQEFERKWKLAEEQASRTQAERAANVAYAAQLDHTKRITPEESAVGNRYPALKSVAAILKFFTFLGIVLVWVGWLMYLQAKPLDPLAPSVIVAVLASFMLWLVGWTYAELMLLAVDVADDLRATRYFLKEMCYRQIGPPRLPPGSPTVEHR